MTCSRCTHWNPRKSGGMARHRMAVCDKGPLWTYLPPHHKCAMFSEAEAKVIAARATWLEKRA